ncbi:MAG: HEAT repeat domain-containing protein [Myxococcota bacterium]
MTRRLVSTLLLPWLLLALAISGCSGCVRRDRIVVHNVHIDMPKQQQAMSLPSSEVLKPWVIAALHASEDVRLVAKQQRDSRVLQVQLQPIQLQNKAHVRVGVYIPQEVQSKQHAVVQGQLQEHAQSQEPTVDCCWGHITVSTDQFREDPQAVLRQAIAKAAKQLQHSKHCKPEVVAAAIKQLQQAITGQPGRLQHGKQIDSPTDLPSILRKLGECQATQAVTTIEQLLVLQRSKQVYRAALQALGRIGNRDSVASMINFTHKQPEKKLMLSAIEAVASIGGKQAAGWLFVLANGHAQDDIRRASAAALQRVCATLAQPQ